MSNFFDLVKNRRSIRQFTGEALTPSEVETLMKAALMAPASKGNNPWQFVLVDDKSKLRQLSEVTSKGSRFIADCSLAIVVLVDPSKSDVWIEDTAVVSTYIQLQAEDLGLGSCWVQIRLRYDFEGWYADKPVRDMLNIPSQFSVLSIIAIGHKAEEKEGHDENSLQWDKVHIGSYKTETDESKKE
jgi:nitroreductase